MNTVLRGFILEIVKEQIKEELDQISADDHRDFTEGKVVALQRFFKAEKIDCSLIIPFDEKLDTNASKEYELGYLEVWDKIMPKILEDLGITNE